MDKSTQKIVSQLNDEVVIKMDSGYVRRPVETKIKIITQSPVTKEIISSGESKKYKAYFKKTTLTHI